MIGSGLANWALPLGALLDALLGDPRGWPHPVRAIGRLIVAGESALRPLAGGNARGERGAGVVLALFVISVTAAAAWLIVLVSDRLGTLGSLLGRSALIYWGLAARGLGHEARLASEAADLPTARRELSQIVGRDTQELEAHEICRACVETVAENGTDAVVSPLFWYAVGGPIALWGFKAVSTLDSMVGYRNDRYRHLGWASARLDDLANLIPVRLTWLLIAAAALILGENARAAWRVGWRDGRKHPSPNAAWSEAAMAGALGVQLGGTVTYGGVSGDKPRLGDPGGTFDRETVRRAIRLVWVVASFAVLLAWVARHWLARAS